ncbi:MAG TPA: energy transducer TonB [Thermoanaerobaculia bacterium]|nr:energy transducer TonB [Thermoanaerobaculia bacterium]
MKRTLALLLLAAVPAFAAHAANGDAVITGLKNLTEVQRLAAFCELSRLSGTALKPTLDPWGTAYRVEISETGSLVASAGSDRKFDETEWKTVEQFTGLEGDIVLVDGKLTRSNRNWLHAQIPEGPSAARTALDELRHAEMMVMTSRNPVMLSVMAARVSASGLELLARHLVAGGGIPAVTTDAWGTPPRVERNGDKLRLVSAGADRKFNPESWTRKPSPSFDEDIVYEDGKIARAPAAIEILMTHEPRIEPIPQPPDPPAGGSESRLRVGGTVVAPKVVRRIEPEYDENARRMRFSGVVIVECVIDERGAIDDVRLVKSLVPDLDMAAVKAVRRWKFEPATSEGKPVAVVFNLSINFKLK